MPRGIGDQDSRWVMLQRPGLNTATIGVLAMVMVHLLVVSTQAIYGGAAVHLIYHEGGLRWFGFSSGKVWQHFTHAWLHGNWEHLLINAFLFYYASARLSHVLSDRRILTLFLLTSLGAGLSHLLMQFAFPATNQGILVGASGGITGMLLAYFAMSPGSRMLLLPVSARNLAKGVLISSALLTVMTPAMGLPFLSDAGIWLEGLLGGEIFQFSHLAHFTGGLLGWAFIDRFFPKLLTREDLARMRMELETSAELQVAKIDGGGRP